MSPVITDSIPPICSQHRAGDVLGGTRDHTRVRFTCDSMGVDPENGHGVETAWCLGCRMPQRQDSPGEGFSCDMALGERGLRVDAPSTGGDFPSHGEVLRVRWGEVLRDYHMKPS